MISVRKWEMIEHLVFKRLNGLIYVILVAFNRSDSSF